MTLSGFAEELGAALLVVNRDLKRDFVGYGKELPKVSWPNNARLAVQLVVNYEEGAQNSPDTSNKLAGPLRSSEEFEPANFLMRDLGTESMFEYGSRVAIWRMLDLFDKYNVKTTFFACGEALEQNPEAARDIVERGHEISSHGYRWYDTGNWNENQVREDISMAVATITRITGIRPVGWKSRSTSVDVRRLLVEEGGFIYDSESYNDEIPYYVRVGKKSHLVIPYTPDNNCNDWVFHSSETRFDNSNSFFQYLKDSFDVLYSEGKANPKMMSVGIHLRISGRPARAVAIERFIEYAKSFPLVWFARRDEIARWWIENYPPPVGLQ